MNTHLFDNSSCVYDEKYEDFFKKRWPVLEKTNVLFSEKPHEPLTQHCL